MDTEHRDLDWLRRMWPAPGVSSTAVTAARRRAILQHALRNDRTAAAGEPTRPRRGIFSGRPLRQASLAGFAALGTFLVATALWSGGGSGVPTSPLSPSAANAAPLMHLASQVVSLPEPGGDATLVVESRQVRGVEDSESANLYLDDGRNYWAPDLRSLETSLADTRDEDPYIKSELTAAAAAARLTPEAGRKGMLSAAPDPFAEGAHDAPETASAPIKEGTATGPVPSTRELIDNLVWLRCLDALTFGDGQPEVRAGVMRIFATLSEVNVGQGEEAGRQTVEVHYDAGPEGYVETLTLDADTGILDKLVGGVAGEAPQVVTTYRTTRVDAAQFGAGSH